MEYNEKRLCGGGYDIDSIFGFTNGRIELCGLPSWTDNSFYKPAYYLTFNHDFSLWAPPQHRQKEPHFLINNNNNENVCKIEKIILISLTSLVFARVNVPSPWILASVVFLDC